MGDEGYLDELMTRLRTLNKVQRTELTMAAEVFVKHKHHEYAKVQCTVHRLAIHPGAERTHLVCIHTSSAQETYLKLEDYKALMELHVKLAKWDEAFGLIKHRPELAPVIYEPYAEWLAINDRFVEAQEAFVLVSFLLFVALQYWWFLLMLLPLSAGGQARASAPHAVAIDGERDSGEQVIVARHVSSGSFELRLTLGACSSAMAFSGSLTPHFTSGSWRGRH